MKRKSFHYIITIYKVVILSKLNQASLQNREQGPTQVHNPVENNGLHDP